MFVRTTELRGPGSRAHLHRCAYRRRPGGQREYTRRSCRARVAPRWSTVQQVRAAHAAAFGVA
eukprot:scaffold80848_cov30-Tisochrysis_lutea.AAC.8